MKRTRVLCALLVATAAGVTQHVSAASGDPGPTITLVSNDPLFTNPTSIATDGVTLYVAVERSVVSVPVGGGTAATLVPDATPDHISGLTRLGGELFWIDPNGAGLGDATAIFKSSTAGGPVSPVYTGSAASGDIAHGADITAGTSALFTIDYVNGRIHSMNPDGSGLTLVGASFDESVGSLHLSTIAEQNGSLYVADSGFQPEFSAPQVFTLPAIGGAPLTLHSGAPLLGLADIAVGDAVVYVADQTANTIWQIPQGGGPPTAVVSGAPFIQIGGIVYWDNALYVTDTGNVGTFDGAGAVYKVDLTPVSLVPTTTTVASSRNPSMVGQAVTFTATVSAAVGTPASGSVEFFDGTNSLGTAGVQTGSAALTTSSLTTGLHSITAEYSGDLIYQGSTSPAITQNVKSPTTTTLTLTPVSQQYSDRETFEATVTPQSGNGNAPAKDVTFKIGSQVMGTAPLVASGNSFKATLSNVPLVEPSSPTGQMAPGSRLAIAVFNDVDPNFSVSNPLRVFTISREDARVTYTGPRSVKTTSPDRRQATITLSVTVNDITATSDASGDNNPGDIRKATVAFVNRETGATLAQVPVSLVSSDDRTTGTASYNWTVDIGTANSKTFKVGFIVVNYYTRNSASDDVSITVTK